MNMTLLPRFHCTIFKMPVKSRDCHLETQFSSSYGILCNLFNSYYSSVHVTNRVSFALKGLIGPLIYMAKRKMNCKIEASKANEYFNLNHNKLSKIDNGAEIQKNDYERLSKD